MAEDRVQAALIMDRSMPVGNSEDVFARRAIHVKVGNRPDEPVYTEETGPSTPKVYNLPMPTASTEYTFTMPDMVKKFTLKNRFNAPMQFCFTQNESNTNFILLPPGVSWTEEGVFTINVKIYIQAPKANQTLEVLTWSQ